MVNAKNVRNVHIWTPNNTAEKDVNINIFNAHVAYGLHQNKIYKSITNGRIMIFGAKIIILKLMLLFLIKKFFLLRKNIRESKKIIILTIHNIFCSKNKLNLSLIIAYNILLLIMIIIIYAVWILLNLNVHVHHIFTTRLHLKNMSADVQMRTVPIK